MSEAGGLALWHGFSLHWILTPHRLDRLLSRVERPGADQVRVSQEVTVGRVPDRPRLETVVHACQNPQPRLLGHGCLRLTLEAEVGCRADAHAEGIPLGFDARPLAADTHPSAIAILDGFALRCESSSAGLHTRGFGFGLATEQREGSLAVRADAWLHAANSPDPLTRSRGTYRYALELFFAVLEATGDLRATPFTISREHRGGRHPPPPSTIPGSEQALCALTGLEFALTQVGPEGGEGRYLRSLQTSLSPGSAQGARWEVAAFFSNRGLVTYPVEATHLVSGVCFAR